MKHARGAGLAGLALAMAIATACTPVSQKLADEGVALAESGDLVAAESRLREAIKADPQNATAAYHLGALAENRADDYQARNWYRRAATRAKDTRVEERDTTVLLSVWALRGLERVNRRIAAEEGQTDKSPPPIPAEVSPPPPPAP
jgi:tetratricopeptide (TPR) repeat protein